MRETRVAGAACASSSKFIRAMRMIASTVTVVTTDGPAGRHGATVSAFSSVSADPPTVLICLRADSRIALAVSENRHLCVNVLAQQSRKVANRFAGRDDGQFTDRFAGIGFHAASGRPPELKGATVFYCQIDKAVRSGSHEIFICHVMQIRESREKPLAYLNGLYHEVVPQIIGDADPAENIAKSV